MIDSLITSKTRIQLLLRFFLNPERSAYLRELADELGESTNGVRVELDRLSDAKLLNSEMNGRTKTYRANMLHPLFNEIQSIVKKTLGIDRLIDDILCCLGDVQHAFITGDYAQGIDSGIIDLIIVGDVNRAYLDTLVNKTEPLIGGRKIRTLVLNTAEYENLAVRQKEKPQFRVYP